VSTAGLVPMMALAERAGLSAPVAEHGSVPGPTGARASAKVAAVVAGVPAGVGQVAWFEVDDTIKAMHGCVQQGVAYGCSNGRSWSSWHSTGVRTPRVTRCGRS